MKQKSNQNDFFFPVFFFLNRLNKKHLRTVSFSSELDTATRTLDLLLNLLMLFT